jgi:hypothetical protein
MRLSPSFYRITAGFLYAFSGSKGRFRGFLKAVSKLVRNFTGAS